MKANEFYLIGRIDQDGQQYVSDAVLDGLEAMQHLALEEALLKLAGWDTLRCSCGWSITATKSGLRRVVVAIPTEDAEALSDVEDVEAIALAVGVLAPASHRDGLVVV